ncbi:MAG TPA: efflux RND transporter periplasmic adaptor subunit [Vicinamibacterales bacterium]|nr:efflux RND transporter periplasmic adaptor subunit [Vicinamibacterales bacterium]
MIGPSGRLSWPIVTVVGVLLVALGVVIGYGISRPVTAPDEGVQIPPVDHSASAAVGGHQHAAMPATEPTTHGSAAATEANPTVTLSADMMTRAGIRTVVATSGATTFELRMPGVVQPNAYKEVVVTSLVSGRVTQVTADLGTQVAAQQPLATVYSPELADAQTAFIAARAEQVAHQQLQTRTQRLTAIGAATRQELEEHEAARAKLDAAVEIARARLALLGIPEERTQRLAGPQDVVTTTPIRAPLPGVVTRRAVNVGQNIDPSMPLFTIVDLSTVWVIADLYERDFARVRVGSPATITSTSYPGMTLRGRVSYIDPQVQPETRTAKLRVEVPNQSGRLRLGMYVDAHIGEGSPRQGLFVPKSAVQIVGRDTVVYVAVDAQQGRFVERPVEIGTENGDRVLVVSGLQAGDAVVTDGVFFLRAESERTRGR